MGRYDDNIDSVAGLIAECVEKGPGLVLTQGHLPGVILINKFGFQPAVGTDEIPIWDDASTYVYQTSAAPVFVQGGASDFTGGAGAGKVSVQGVGPGYVKASVIVAMASTAGVSTTQAFLRVYRAQVTSVGVNGTAAADITIKARDGSNQAIIKQGENQTLMAMYTVPAGKTAYIPRVDVGSFGNPNASIIFRLRTRAPGTGKPFQVKNKSIVTRAQVPIEYTYHAMLPEKTDIQITAQGSTSGMDANGNAQIIVIDNDSPVA